MGLQLHVKFSAAGTKYLSVKRQRFEGTFDDQACQDAFLILCKYYALLNKLIFQS